MLVGLAVRDALVAARAFASVAVGPEARAADR
jgi:hypothetical protein